jgi:uncharacterized membrane protein
LTKIRQKFVAMFCCPVDGFTENMLQNFFIRFVKAAEEVMSVLSLHVGVGRK